MLRGLGLLLVRFFFGKANGSRTGKSVAGLISFLVAALMWLLVTLNQEFETTISLPIVLEKGESQKNILVTSPLPGPLQVRVKARGIDLLAYHVFLADRPLSLDFVRQNGRFSSQDLFTLTRNRLPNSLVIEKVLADELVITYEGETKRRVPVYLDSRLAPAPAFRLKRLLSIYPDSVTLSGPQLAMDTISRWGTAKGKWSVHPDQTSLRLPLASDSGRVLVEEEEVVVTFEQEEYTETTIHARLLAVDFPKGTSVRFFPETIALTCLTPMSRYEEIRRLDRQSGFEIRVNPSELDPETGRFIPSTGYLPPDLVVVKRNPADVRFILASLTL